MTHDKEDRAAGGMKDAALPDPPCPGPQPFKFDRPLQRDIYERLGRLVGPGPAAFYKDACYLMSVPHSLAAVRHVVGHLWRETDCGLLDVLSTLPNTLRGTSARKNKPSKKAQDGRKSKIHAILSELGIGDDGDAEFWSLLTLHMEAHRNSSEPPRPLDARFCTDWERYSEVLHLLLSRAETRFLVFLQFLDGLLKKEAPTEDDAKELKKKVPVHWIVQQHFFSKADATWLEPLYKADLFTYPPGLVSADEEGRQFWEPWPQSQYLVRMAKLGRPELCERVMKVVLGIQQSGTDNPIVREDLAEAVLYLPVDRVAEWARQEAVWVSEQDYLYFRLPARMGAVISYLATGGQVDASLTLAHSLLAPRRDENAPDSVDEPQPRLSVYDYEKIVEQHLPKLVEAGREKALELLCDLLDDAVTIAAGGRYPDKDRDGSRYWRESIGDYSFHRFGVKDVLVTAVRDSAKQLVDADPARIRVIVEALEERRWPVFRRIALYLLRVFPAADPSLVGERLIGENVLYPPETVEEYDELARDCFAQLPAEQQTRLLGLIEKGPPFCRNPEGARDLRLSQRDRLSAIREHLPPQAKARLDELESEFGKRSKVRLDVWSGPPPSPKSVDELLAMPVEDVARFLREWRPQNFLRESVSRLAGALGDAATREPSRFAAAALLFTGTYPAYLSSLLHGFRTAVGEKRAFDWSPVLQLCLWAAEETRELSLPDVGDDERRSVTWGWARQAVADLVSKAFETEDGGIPFGLRDDVWKVILALTHDPEPTTADEARQRGIGMAPEDSATNTIRGRAMHAVVRYALWVRRHAETTAGEGGSPLVGFDLMPEVRDVLDEHLDVAKEPALAIRYIYGAWFPYLVSLDSTWATGNVRRIFPAEDDLCEFRDAAWNAYVLSSWPYENVIDLLRDEYRRAAGDVRSILEEKRSGRDLDERLAEHLMILCWRGKVSLDEQDSPLAIFYRNASDALRAHALEFIGRSVFGKDEILESEVKDRLALLWEHRLAEAKKASSKAQYTAEMAAFGLWFSSEKFDQAWSVAQLEEALEVSGRVERAELVADSLAKLAPTMPAEAVRCLTLMVHGDKEGWHVGEWVSSVQTLLRVAIDSGNQAARKEAIDLVHCLGAHGFYGYRDLLPK
ncbi:MAG: hypothetical protein JW889_00255 [Verrucomicrobia bacterium]|nr:hypothetical protein [Verrucomicrobiota bacterium]